MTNEIWKPIAGFGGAYEVSSLGRIKSYKRKEAKIMSLRNRNGYLFAHLDNKYYAVHRIVGIAFIPNIDAKPCIDHINGNRSDNRVENLRWCTHKENINNPLTIQKYKARVGEKNSFYGKHHKQGAKEKISLAAKGRVGEKNSFWGKHHTQESIELMTQKRWATKV